MPISMHVFGLMNKLISLLNKNTNMLFLTITHKNTLTHTITNKIKLKDTIWLFQTQLFTPLLGIQLIWPTKHLKILQQFNLHLSFQWTSLTWHLKILLLKTFRAFWISLFLNKISLKQIFLLKKVENIQKTSMNNF